MLRREDTEKFLIEIIEPLLEKMGFELVKLDYITGKQKRLHIFIDHENGISIKDCETASRAVSDLLDRKDPLEHSYLLEVSSPGQVRPLTRKTHFEKFQGYRINVKTNEPIGESKNFSGVLLLFQSDFIVIKLDDGREVKVPLNLINRANLSDK